MERGVRVWAVAVAVAVGQGLEAEQGGDVGRDRALGPEPERIGLGLFKVLFIDFALERENVLFECFLFVV